ncbi:hypothetical protein JCM6882_000102, partial [Rhodosporidiobolus microsporus]
MSSYDPYNNPYGAPPGPQPRRSHTPQSTNMDPLSQQQQQQHPGQSQSPFNDPYPPYDPHAPDPYAHQPPHQQGQQQADYATGGAAQYAHAGNTAADPFATPGVQYGGQQQQEPWAMPVPGQQQYHSQGDLGAYGAPPPPSHQAQYGDDDHPQDSAPLLAPQGHASGHGHNRWSTSGPLPGQADPSLGLPGGFDPTLPGAPAGYGGDDDQQSVVRYGRIPQRQPRRYKTVKRVQLYHGNLVLDCQVPPKLLERCPRKDDREFTHMRYTAATCDPDAFLDERYSLRQILYETPRRTELFIVLTMYNEDEVLFCRTMHGVMKNIQKLCERNRSKTWGADGWKKGQS